MSRVDIGDLLTIDVGAEVRKLSQAQLEGSWQIPAELVRRAIAAGARTVSVRVARTGFVVVDDGEPIDGETRAALAQVLDAASASTARHAALIALERTGALALLAIGGLGAARVRVERGDGSTRVDVRADLDAARTRASLAAACRFAPEAVAITVDDRPLPRGFAGSAIEARVGPPLPGRASLPHADAQNATVWLLMDGVVAAHLSSPGVPAHEAAVEAGPLLRAGDRSAAALREAVEPLLPALADAACVALLREAARTPPGPGSRPPLCRLVLEIAHRGGAALTGARALRVFPTVGAGDGARRATEHATLDELEAATRSGGGTLPAIFPGQDPRGFLFEGRTWVLDATERARLAKVLAIVFRPPPARPRTGGVSARLRGAWSAMRRNASTVAWRLTFARPIAEEALMPDERAFLEALRDAGVTDARFLAGAGPARSATARLFLPRANPLVRDAVRAVARDRAAIYAALLALSDGRQLPPPSCRTAYYGG